MVFVDTDPGFGKATRLPLPAGTSTGTIFEIGSQAPGGHDLYIRALDESGKWSITQSIHFLSIDIDYIKTAQVVAAEWFFDKDPGFGNANAVPAFPPGLDVEIPAFNVAIPSSMAAGIHTFYVRAKNFHEPSSMNAKDAWSITQYSQFIKVDKPVQANIVAIEYFIGTVNK